MNKGQGQIQERGWRDVYVSGRVYINNILYLFTHHYRVSETEMFVFTEVRRRGVPILMVSSGGYQVHTFTMYNILILKIYNFFLF